MSTPVRYRRLLLSFLVAGTLAAGCGDDDDAALRTSAIGDSRAAAEPRPGTTAPAAGEADATTTTVRDRSTSGEGRPGATTPPTRPAAGQARESAPPAAAVELPDVAVRIAPATLSQSGGGAGCASTGLVRAVVREPSPASVVAKWTGPESGEATLTEEHPGSFQASIGPFDTAGQYEVTVTVTNAQGEKASSSASFTISGTCTPPTTAAAQTGETPPAPMGTRPAR